MIQAKYISRTDVKKYIKLFEEIFIPIQRKLKKENGLTFTYRLVGSSKRGLVVNHPTKGFDCDFQLFLQKNKQKLSLKKIKHLIIDEFNSVIIRYGFDCFENKTHEIRTKIKEDSKIRFAFDIVVMKETNATPYVLTKTPSNEYVWNELQDYRTWSLDYKKIQGNKMWEDLRNRYYDKKIKKMNGTHYKDKKSFQILHEAVKETLSRF